MKDGRCYQRGTRNGKLEGDRAREERVTLNTRPFLKPQYYDLWHASFFQTVAEDVNDECDLLQNEKKLDRR